LDSWELPAERIALGPAYKPSMARLPDGELVMVALFGEQLGDGKMREWTEIWRSSDGGRSWSEPAVIADMIGREQWLTATSDGTLFATCHLLANDVNNPDDYTHSYLHRSTDGGKTWERLRIGPEGFPPQAHTALSRNVVELADGTLVLGVSVTDSDLAYMWKSDDGGVSWDRSEPPVQIGSYRGQPYDNFDGFFSEDFTFCTESGKLLHFIRCGPPSPMYPMEDGRVTPSGNDGIDRMLCTESTDNGRTWSELCDLGDYGMHYPRVVQLQDGRLLMTFTQRALYYPIGLQAVLSYDGGETWDFNSDRIIIEGKTPWGMPSGGGFGNTLQLDDGTLISCYTYAGADAGEYAIGQNMQLEVVRWALPPR